MTPIEFDRKQVEKQGELLWGPAPTTREEQDIWNLKYLRYSIRHGSRNYRMGMIASLDRVIKKLESEKDVLNKKVL